MGKNNLVATRNFHFVLCMKFVRINIYDIFYLSWVNFYIQPNSYGSKIISRGKTMSFKKKNHKNIVYRIQKIFLNKNRPICMLYK